MQIKVRLSGSLKAIYEELPKESQIELNKSETIENLLVKMNINPLVVMNVAVNGKAESKDFIIKEDSEVYIIGPISGG